MAGQKSKKTNSVVPPRGSDDVVRPKRATKSASTNEKLAMKGSKTVVGIGKKISRKAGTKGRSLTKDLEDIEYDDEGLMN
ncbi:hypothetical protein Tco_1118386 [Tanacetum coccineum]